MPDNPYLTDPLDPASATVVEPQPTGWRGWKPIRKIMAAALAVIGAPPVVTVAIEDGSWDWKTYLVNLGVALVPVLAGYFVPSKAEELK